jgi:polysaccharide deacetylase 2 family uncharacterized protein YibQ
MNIKRNRPRRAAKQQKKRTINRLLIPLGIAALVVTSFLATGYFIFLRTGPTTGIPPYLSSDELKTQVPVLQSSRSKISINQLKPQIAIVIDDMGYRKTTGDALLELDLDLTFSFLPHAPNAASQALKAQKMGRDVLLHLPLEPDDPTWNLGPGGLYLTMNRHELLNTFTRDLAVVPMAVGINNHMGSLFTENEKAMQTLLEIIKSKKLFFVDSLTSSNSLGYDVARSLGIKTAKRNLFLDNEHEDKKVGSQLLELIALAEQQGYAIGLAHPFPSTLAALKEHKEIFSSRVELVGVSKLVQ